MPTRQMKVGFFQVVVTNPNTPVAFNAILQTLNAIPNDRRRTMLAADEPVRLRLLQQTGGGWLGDLGKIRLHEDLDKSTIDGIETKIPLQDDEGLLEKTAFFYHPRTKIIAIQQLAGSVSASSCGRYFKTLGGVQKIEFRPVIKDDALTRIMQMGTVEKFQIRFAGIDSGRPLRGGHASARNMIQSLRNLRAPKASINLQIDRDTTTLEHVGQFIADALDWDRRGDLTVEKILVVGSDGEADEISVIDLFKDRVVEILPVEVQDGRKFDDASRYSAVRTAWNRQQASLAERFGNAN